MSSNVHGFFGPGSVVWKVDRELAVLLGSGARALLLQVAHPKVAAAVIDHSRYDTDALGRLRHTLAAIYSFAFADADRANDWVQKVNRRHAAVKGNLPEAVGSHPSGSSYQALDPELLLWVYATLIDSSLVAYEHFVGVLAPDERETFYQEMRAAGPVWGIPPALFPESLPELRGWMASLIARGEVAAGPQARVIARRVLRSPAWWIPQPAMLPGSLAAVWLLPPTLREGFRLPWGARRDALMQRAAGFSRWLVPRLPPLLRYVPEARAADRRAKRGNRRP